MSSNRPWNSWHTIQSDSSVISLILNIQVGIFQSIFIWLHTGAAWTGKVRPDMPIRSRITGNMFPEVIDAQSTNANSLILFKGSICWPECGWSLDPFLGPLSSNHYLTALIFCVMVSEPQICNKTLFWFNLMYNMNLCQSLKLYNKSLLSLHNLSADICWKFAVYN